MKTYTTWLRALLWNNWTKLKPAPGQPQTQPDPEPQIIKPAPIDPADMVHRS